MKKRYFHQDLIMPCLGLVIGGFFLFASQKVASSSDDFPKAFSAMVVVFAIINLFDAIKAHKAGIELLKNGSEAPGMIRLDDLKIPALAIGGLIAYVASIKYIGYFVSTAIFMPAMIRSLKYKNWKVIIAVTVIMELFVYLIFVKFLYVRMPQALLF